MAEIDIDKAYTGKHNENIMKSREVSGVEETHVDRGLFDSSARITEFLYPC